MKEFDFGVGPDGITIKGYTFGDPYGSQITMISYGARIQSWHAPDQRGRMADIVLGYDDAESYLADKTFMGATIGRYANRIRGGAFELNGEQYVVPANDGDNALHGGAGGFSQQHWNSQPIHFDGRIGVMFSIISLDGAMGFPGTVTLSVTYRLGIEDDLLITYAAATHLPTVVNFTNHTYFNLAGHDSGDIRGHVLQTNANYFTPTNIDNLPSGVPEPVDGTALDFRKPRTVGAIDYDHNVVLSSRVAAELTDPTSGRTLTVTTSQPAMQLYTGHQIPTGLVGKGGTTYGPYAGMCLETQHFPDSPNDPLAPSTLLLPGESFYSTTMYQVR